MFIRQDGPELEVLAPAKINLFLEVTGKRDDGFHDLDMLMVPVALYDTLKLIQQQSPEISLTSRWAFGLESQPALPPAHENLVIQALELFQQHLQEKHGKSFGLSVDLVKRIPAAAGLGGASSDAAAALVGANRLNGNLLSLEELTFMAAQVGSDVPFFLYRLRLVVRGVAKSDSCFQSAAPAGGVGEAHSRFVDTFRLWESG